MHICERITAADREVGCSRTEAFTGTGTVSRCAAAEQGSAGSGNCKRADSWPPGVVTGVSGDI